jgi:hypothetical protein
MEATLAVLKEYSRILVGITHRKKKEKKKIDL